MQIKDLIPEEVDFIVVHSTFTTILQDLTVQDIEKQKRDQGYFDNTGFHWIITRNGAPHTDVPMHKQGLHTPRWAGKSLGILLVGGKSTKGKPADNYTVQQKATLTQLLHVLKKDHFHNAKVIGAGELLGGTAPHFDLRSLHHEPDEPDAASPEDRQDTDRA